MAAHKKVKFTKYVFPKNTCGHDVCDGEVCILNMCPMRERDIMEWKYVSYLHIPILGGFKRLLRRNKKGKEVVVYEKLASREDKKPMRLWNLLELSSFLEKHKINLTIDAFTFEKNLDTEKVLDQVNFWKNLAIQDFSKGNELLMINVLNYVEMGAPEIEEYLMKSVFKDETHKYQTKTCCDCTDNCKDKLKCACFLETLSRYNPAEMKGHAAHELGYDFKRLDFSKMNLSGIYECNSRCVCNDSCINRVAQYPSKWKFQLFYHKKTMAKGWAVRTLNDIPAGAFVIQYTGVMSQEDEANVKADSKDWLSEGYWKYIVNLQVIQNGRRIENREEIIQKALQSKPPPPKVPPAFFRKANALPPPEIKVAAHTQQRGQIFIQPNYNVEIQQFRAILQKQWHEKKECLKTPKPKVQQQPGKITKKKKSKSKPKMSLQKAKENMAKEELATQKFDAGKAREKLMQLKIKKLELVQNENLEKVKGKKGKGVTKTTTPLSPSKLANQISEPQGNRNRGYSLREEKEKKSYTTEKYDELTKISRKDCFIKPKLVVSKNLYLLDARKKGNIGRYFNHSCDPNMFTQYVFTETHDVRFPLVAFFAKRNIKAGEELTWCYNYDNDEVIEGLERIPCLCGAKNCKGTLI